MWCPLCGVEYDTWLTRCSDCEIDLVRPPDMPARSLADRCVRGRRYAKSAASMFEESHAALTGLGLRVERADPVEFVILAARTRRLRDTLDVVVRVRPKYEDGCIIECWAQTTEAWTSAIWHAAAVLQGGLDGADYEPRVFPDVFLTRLEP